MAKNETRYALMTLQVIGSGYPIQIHGERIEVPNSTGIHSLAREAFDELMKEIATKAYKKLQEKLPKQ